MLHGTIFLTTIFNQQQLARGLTFSVAFCRGNLLQVFEDRFKRKTWKCVTATKCCVNDFFFRGLCLAHDNNFEQSNVTLQIVSCIIT